MKISSTSHYDLCHAVSRSASGIGGTESGLPGPNTSSQVPEVLKPLVSHTWRTSGARVSLCCDQIVHQIRGHRPGEGFVGGGNVVARVAQHADLVLHLHHQDGVLLAVHLADVAHQGGESPRVGVAGGVAKGGEDVQGLAGAVLDPREPLRVGLDPGRLVGGFAVLPASEPEDDQAQMILPGALDGVVHGGEIEPAFLRLDLFPDDGGQDGVEVALGEGGPDRLHVGAACGAGIVQFAGGHQERFAVHHQLARRRAGFPSAGCGIVSAACAVPGTPPARRPGQGRL